MNTTEWTPRIATADRYLDAQYLLMASATGEAPIEETLARLDDVRRSRVAFGAIPPPEFREEREFSHHEASDAVVFLEKQLKAKQNEDLVERWLVAADLPNEIREFERIHGLKIDPDNDLVVIGGSNSASIRDGLRGRFRRLIGLESVLDGHDRSTINERKLLMVIASLPDITTIRPNSIHYVNNDAPEDVKDSHLKILKDRVELFYVSRNTNVLMAPIWTPNILKNLLRFLSDGRNILDLNKILLGKTAVVIGAGPSVDELLPKIAAVQDRVIVICAFKALKAVTSYGINPDIVVCLDPKQKIRHLEGVDLSKIGAFAVEAAANDELVETIKECPVLPFVASQVPQELIRSVGGIDIPHMSTGGSAVHGAIQTALLLGCRTIYLAGTDFGFPDNRLYALGAGTGDEFTVSEDGLSYKRQPLDSHYRGGELFPVPANDGRTIGASMEMIQFREWTEGRIAVTAEFDQPCEYFNLCYHGAVIKGAPYATEIDESTIGKERKVSMRDIVTSAKNVATMTPKAVKSRFRSRADRLRKMMTICDEILTKHLRNQDWNGDLQKMIKHARRCVEISTLITAKLIKLNEYTSRVKSVDRAEADALLLKLVKDTKVAAEELIPIYVNAGSAATGRKH